MKQDLIIILDLGAENNTVIARDIRSLGVYSEIHPHDISKDELLAMPTLKGIVINGGPNNIVAEVANCGIPIFCVDHQGCIDQNLPSWPKDNDKRLDVLKDFVFNICHAEKNWNMDNFIADQIEILRETIGNKKVLLALSGGVDSSVVAALLLKAIGQQLYCVHVNHGLMRKGESEQVVSVFKEQLGANLTYIDATNRYLEKLAGIDDPEQKRKIIRVYKR